MNEVKNDGISNDIPSSPVGNTIETPTAVQTEVQPTPVSQTEVQPTSVSQTEVQPVPITQSKVEPAPEVVESKEEPKKESKVTPVDNPAVINGTIGNESLFDGTFMDMFAYNFLKGWLTAITLTIGKPFGENIVYDYEINHSIIEGRRLKYDVKGTEYFAAHFKWVVLTVITFGIYAWFIPVRREQFITSKTHYEDDSLVPGQSYFDGKVMSLIGINLLCYILNLITLFIAYPFTLCIKERWIYKHKVVSGKRLKFTGKGIQLIGNWLKWLFFSIITLGIYALWIPLKKKQWVTKHLVTTDEEITNSNKGTIFGLIAIVVIVLILSLSIPKIGKLIEDISNGDFNIRTVLVPELDQVPFEESNYNY